MTFRHPVMYVKSAFMCMDGYFACALPEEGYQISLNCSSRGCELLCGCWESSAGPREEQPVLLKLSHLSSPRLRFCRNYRIYLVRGSGGLSKVIRTKEESVGLLGFCVGLSA